MNKLPRILALEKSFEDSGSFPVSFNNLDSLMRSDNNTKPKKKSQKLKKKKAKEVKNAILAISNFLISNFLKIK